MLRGDPAGGGASLLVTAGQRWPGWGRPTGRRCGNRRSSRARPTTSAVSGRPGCRSPSWRTVRTGSRPGSAGRGRCSATRATPAGPRYWNASMPLWCRPPLRSRWGRAAAGRRPAAYAKPACGFLAVRGERPVHRRARGGRHGLAAVGVGRDRFESARPAPVRRTQERRARTSSMREASATQAAVARSMNRARSGYRPGVLRAAGARCPRGGRCGCGTCAAA